VVLDVIDVLALAAEDVPYLLKGVLVLVDKLAFGDILDCEILKHLFGGLGGCLFRLAEELGDDHDAHESVVAFEDFECFGGFVLDLQLWCVFGLFPEGTEIDYLY
jgi:hypothetical protein